MNQAKTSRFSGIRLLRALIAHFEGLRGANHQVAVRAYASGEFLISERDPIWKSRAVYAMAHSGFHQTLWYIGITGEAKRRQLPSYAAKRIRHGIIKSVWELDPCYELHLFPIERLRSDKELIAHFNPPCNTAFNLIKAAEALARCRLATLHAVRNSPGIYRSQLLSASGIGKAHGEQCIVDLVSAGLISELKVDAHWQNRRTYWPVARSDPESAV